MWVGQAVDQVLHDHDHETFAESPHFIYICAGASEVCAGERKTFYASPCPAQPTPLSLFEKNDGSVGGDGDGDYDGGNGEGDENGDDTDDADDADGGDGDGDDMIMMMMTMMMTMTIMTMVTMVTMVVRMRMRMRMIIIPILPSIIII